MIWVVTFFRSLLEETYQVNIGKNKSESDNVRDYLTYNKVPLSFWFNHFLDSRAEIHQFFVLFFGKCKTSKSQFIFYRKATIYHKYYFINILLSIIFPMFQIDHLLQMVPMVVCRNFCFEVQNSYKIIGFVLRLQITIGNLFSWPQQIWKSVAK